MIEIPNLQKGDRGQKISQWQAFLLTQGSQLEVDSDFGIQTDKATREYQREEGLLDDGIIGERTYELAMVAGWKTAMKPVFPHVSPRFELAHHIVWDEAGYARRDSYGRLKVYYLGSDDGGGKYEVAGINERYHEETVKKIMRLIQLGKHVESEEVTALHIADYTDGVASWSESRAVEYYLRDCAFNRGPTGAARIAQIAIGVEVDGDFGSVSKARIKDMGSDVGDLLNKLRSSREAYERMPKNGRPGRDESSRYWKGLVNRWNNTLDLARTFA